MVEIQIQYNGQLSCVATHGPSGCELTTDAPVDNHGRGLSFSPTDLVATALGTCVATIMAIYAEKHQLDLKGTKVHVEKHMSSDLPRRIARLPVTVSVPLPVEDRYKKGLEAAGENCPVRKSLREDIEIPIKFVYETV